MHLHQGEERDLKDLEEKTEQVQKSVDWIMNLLKVILLSGQLTSNLLFLTMIKMNFDFTTLYS